MLQIKKLGVVIVLIALITSLFIGVITNTTSEIQTVTKYEYVTDMSQTFSYSEQPNYLQFNPTSNYTGYILSNGNAPGVAYTESNSPSNYRMAVDRDSNTNTVEMSTFTPDSSLTMPNSVVNYDDTRVRNTPAVNQTTMKRILISNPNVIPLRSVIERVTTGMPADTRTVTLTFNSGTDVNISDYPYTIDLNRTFYLNKTISRLESLEGIWWTGPTPVDYYGAAYDYRTVSFADRDQVIDHYITNSYSIVYNVAQNSANMNNNGTYRAIDIDETYVMWLGSSSDVIFHQYVSPDNTYGPTVTVDEPWTNRLWVTYDAYEQSYIKINDGVRISNTNNTLTTNWSNQNSNASLDIIFGKNNETLMDNTFTLNYEGNVGKTLNVSRTNNGNVLLTDNGSSYNLGTWDYLLFRINALDGRLLVYPVSSFTNYTQYITANSPLVIGSTTYLTIPSGVINSISWDAVGTDPNIENGGYTSFTFSISNTTIRDSNRLLMVNPSIDINNFFKTANADGWRLNFYSFGMQGSSMTVNGQTFDVSDGNITINGITKPLSNVYVSYDKLTNHVYFTFEKEKYTIDLGEWTTSLISFGGIWFFNTSYYEAHIVDQTNTNIKWTQLPPMGTVSLIFIAITLILMAIGIKKFGFGLSDYIVTLVSLAVAFCFLEAFI